MDYSMTVQALSMRADCLLGVTRIPEQAGSASFCYRQRRAQNPALPSALPTAMFFARRPPFPVRTARPVALMRAAR
jgi:hypothetical protein